jgi:hypothetical protein
LERILALLKLLQEKLLSEQPQEEGLLFCGDQIRLSISWNFYCCALSFWGQNPKTSILAIKIPGNKKPALVTF